MTEQERYEIMYDEIVELKNIIKQKDAEIEDLRLTYKIQCEATDRFIKHCDDQYAEIEKLRKDSADIDNFARNICRERMLKGKAIADYEDLHSYIRKREAEALKDFAEKLYDKAIYSEDINQIVVCVHNIDNLVKEMVGE